MSAIASRAVEYTRQRDWFDPDKTPAHVTIVGCGGIGSFAAFALAKLGVQDIALLDFDSVEPHNIPNQLFAADQLGETKVEALASSLAAFADVFPDMYDKTLQDGVPLKEIVVSALDSMTARADLWEQVKYKLACKLFIDARLGGENVVLYCVRPCNLTDIEGYEATLHSDDEGLELPCTGRSIIDVGFAVGSLITRAVRKFYADEPATPVVYLDQATLDIFKGDWS